MMNKILRYFCVYSNIAIFIVLFGYLLILSPIEVGFYLLFNFFVGFFLGSVRLVVFFVCVVVVVEPLMSGTGCSAGR